MGTGSEQMFLKVEKNATGKHIRKCSVLVSVREMKSENAVRYILIPVKRLLSKKLKVEHADEVLENRTSQNIPLLRMQLSRATLDEIHIKYHGRWFRVHILQTKTSVHIPRGLYISKLADLHSGVLYMNNCVFSLHHEIFVSIYT